MMGFFLTFKCLVNQAVTPPECGYPSRIGWKGILMVCFNVFVFSHFALYHDGYWRSLLIRHNLMIVESGKKG
jgi:hypothetical protein